MAAGNPQPKTDGELEELALAVAQGYNASKEALAAKEKALAALTQNPDSDANQAAFQKSVPPLQTAIKSYYTAKDGLFGRAKQLNPELFPSLQACGDDHVKQEMARRTGNATLHTFLNDYIQAIAVKQSLSIPETGYYETGKKIISGIQ